ncbi:MAG: hypothetical protein WAX69_17000 [Victivallales bacterium]
MARIIDYYPRCFKYCEVPVFQGSKLLYARDDIEYQFYLEWLSTYLDRVKYEVPDCQLELCAWAAEEKPKYVASGLGDNGFYHLLTMRDLISHIEGGSSYVEAVNHFREMHEERVREFDGDLEMVDPFESWISPFLWKETERELNEERMLAGEATHADLGYRVPMAIAMKGLPSLKQKYEFLDSFYWSFNEEASK